MRGGHNIKPVSEKKMLGTSQPVRDKNRLENFITSEKSIEAPPGLSARALEKWNWVCDKRSAHGVLTDADRDAIRIYSENWVLYEDCAADVQENGTYLWVETSAGKKPMTNPAFRHMKDCESILRQIWDLFGFTPRARMGLKVEKSAPKEKSFFEKLMEEAAADA